MKIAIIADELYPFFFTSKNTGLWKEETVDLPEDFDYSDYITTCEKWNYYQDRLEKIHNNVKS